MSYDPFGPANSASPFDDFFKRYFGGGSVPQRPARRATLVSC